MSKKESPKKREREHKSEYAVHIQKALAIMMMMDETHEKPAKRGRKPESQKLPIEFFEFYLQIAKTKNLLRINQMVQMKNDHHDINLASFLMGFWPNMNQVEYRYPQKMSEILNRLIFSMKAGIAKIDMEMLNDRLWATILIHGIYEFIWDVTDNFLILCQMTDGTFQFYSFLDLMYVDNTDPYLEIDISNYTPQMIDPVHHFMDVHLPKA
jgi:hypothetical protein